MAIARAAYDFFSSVSAAGHHEERRRHKRPKGKLCDSFFLAGNCVCGILSGKRQRTQFLLSILQAVLTLGSHEVSSHFEEYKSRSRMQEKSALQANYFTPYSDLGMKERSVAVFRLLNVSKSCL